MFQVCGLHTLYDLHEGTGPHVVRRRRVDALALESLSLLRDVRGYTVYRIAGELQGMEIKILGNVTE
jgi:hypothetical protein